MITPSELHQHLILLKYPADGMQPAPAGIAGDHGSLRTLDGRPAKAGRLAATNGLENTGKVLRGPIGETVVTDGPFAEGKEVVGGYVLLNPCTLDEALAGCARVSGTRPSDDC